MKLHLLLKHMREESSKTQEEMADYLRIPLPTYKMLEYGEPLWETHGIVEYIKERKRLDEELDSVRRHELHVDSRPSRQDD